MKFFPATFAIKLFSLVILTSYSISITATSYSDSILDIPKNTLFELRNELKISGNRNFIVLGQNRLNESFNQINQSLNQQNSQYYNNAYNRYRNASFHHYNDYISLWKESADQSYQNCLERNRVYYGNDSYYQNNRQNNRQNNNSTIISRGHGNTNIIINGNQASGQYQGGSYIGANSCIKPEHSLAMLLIDKNKADGGGVFREGYKFKVRSVKHRRSGGFHIITINFDHDIAKGIRIITTTAPNGISINQLKYTSSGDGFWESLGAGLASMIDIGGNHFNIRFPSARYYN